MKKGIYVLFLGLLALIFIAGCANLENQARGYNNSVLVPQTGPQPQNLNQYPTTANNEFSQIKSELQETNRLLREFLSGQSRQKTVKQETKERQLDMGTLSKNQTKKTGSRASPQKNVAANQREIDSLKDRVGRLEVLMDYEHPGIDTGRVTYEPAESLLDTKSKIYLNKKIKEHLEGKIEILGINGYASATKPKIEGMTNWDYAQARMLEVRQYLKENGIELKDEQCRVIGQTSQFSENRNTTLIFRTLSSEEVRKKKGCQNDPQ